MGRIKYYEKPTALGDAVAMLQERRGAASILAGGTSLALRQPPGIDTLVDISGLGLAGFEDRGGAVAILACTPVAELESNDFCRNAYSGVLARAASRVGSTPLRNRITVAGNVVQVLPWSDLPGVFLALNATVVVEGTHPRTFTAADFFNGHPRNLLRAGDIVTEIRVPKPVGRVTASFVKVSKTTFDYASLSVTTACWFNGKTVTDCSVALASVRPLPVRVPQCEEEIAGKIPERDDIIRAAARASGAVEPSRDYRYSQDYRRQLIKVWVKRCLHETLS
jgi:aerobic carbon-monoxide dehydrogenase medium subunit